MFSSFIGMIYIEYNTKVDTYWKTAKVGENIVEPDTFYKFDSGYLIPEETPCADSKVSYIKLSK
jgi:hypothetical protein